MNIIRNSEPATEPVSLSDAKEHLNIETTFTDDDNYISSLITTARQLLEDQAGIALMEASYYAYFDTWSTSGKLYLPIRPVSAISKVEYLESRDNNTYTELPTPEYDAAVQYNPPCIMLYSVPSIAYRLNAIRVSFTAGSSSADNVNAYAKHAIKILVAHFYANRQEEVAGNVINKLEKGFEYLVDNLKVMYG